jgi:hypothetical protein
MRFTRRAIVVTHASLQFVGTQNAVSFADVAFAMHPLGLNGVEPGTFGGQQTRQDANALPSLLHFLIVAADPGSKRFIIGLRFCLLLLGFFCSRDWCDESHRFIFPSEFSRCLGSFYLLSNFYQIRHVGDVNGCWVCHGETIIPNHRLVANTKNADDERVRRNKRKNTSSVSVVGFCASLRHCRSSYQDRWSCLFCAQFYLLGIALTHKTAFW